MPAPQERADRAAWAGLVTAVLLVAAAMAVPAVSGWDVHVRHFPPLHADWRPRVGPGSLPAILLAILAGWQAVTLSERLPWRRLLVATYVVGLAWMLSLAFVDGPDGVGRILGTSYEYLRTARATTDLPHTLSVYVSLIPYDPGGGHWPPHVAGHPPGALLFFVVLVRLGLGSGFAAGMVVTVLAASTAVAVLLTLKVLGAEALARRAAPFVVLGPAAIWQCVSADAMFAAVAAWGMVALALAATRRSLPWSLLAGLLLGCCVMLSYGLPVLGLLAVAVLVVARSWRPLLPAAAGALAVVIAFAAYGFRWWEALPVLHDRYWIGVARNRPAAYWAWGDLAALAISAGPLVGAGLAQTLVRSRDTITDAGTRVVVWLSGAAVAMVLTADASQMSKAEVERIWLPFVPWLLVSCALLPERWRRRGLVLQLVAALAVEHLLATGW
ncbi:methylthioxylose transferase [Marmoricola sp. URHA0025 HA25]